MVTKIIYFNEISLIKALSSGSDDKASTFAASCASRLVNNVTKYNNNLKSGQLLAEVRNSVWDSIMTGKIIDRLSFEVSILNAMPSEEEDMSFEAAVVEDACAAMVYALRSFDEESAQNAAWAARRSYETADRFVSQSINESEYSDSSEDQIINHHIIQRELQRQARDLDILLNVSNNKIEYIDMINMSYMETVLD